MRVASTSGLKRPSIGRAYLVSRTSTLRVNAIASSDVKTGRVSSGEGKPWVPSSWRNFPAQQQPEYPDPQAVKDTLTQLGAYPPLIFAGECRTLQSRLAKAATGEAFIVQVRLISEWISYELNMHRATLAARTRSDDTEILRHRVHAYLSHQPPTLSCREATAQRPSLSSAPTASVISTGSSCRWLSWWPLVAASPS